MEEKAEAENGIVGIIPAVNHKKEKGYNRSMSTATATDEAKRNQT